MDAIHYQMIDVLKEKQLVQNGDKIVITHGDGKYFKEGTTNSLRVEIIKDIPRVDLEKKSHNKFQKVDTDKGGFLLDTSLCASCQNCVTICPHGIWAVTDDKKQNTYIDEKKAVECSFDMECVEACPTGAIEILSTKI